MGTDLKGNAATISHDQPHEQRKEKDFLKRLGFSEASLIAAGNCHVVLRLLQQAR